MAKRRIKTESKKQQRISSLMKRHKALTILLIVGVFALALVGTFNYISYANKFSKEDFSKMVSTAEGVLKRTGAEDIEKIRGMQL